MFGVPLLSLTCSSNTCSHKIKSTKFEGYLLAAVATGFKKLCRELNLNRVCWSYDDESRGWVGGCRVAACAGWVGAAAPLLDGWVLGCFPPTSPAPPPAAPTAAPTFPQPAMQCTTRQCTGHWISTSGERAHVAAAVGEYTHGREMGAFEICGHVYLRFVGFRFVLVLYLVLQWSMLCLWQIFFL